MSAINLLNNVTFVNSGKTANPVAKAITDNAQKMNAIYNSSSSNSSGESSSESGENGGDTPISDGSNTGDSSESKPKQPSPEVLKLINAAKKMPDSNISSYNNKSDIWNQFVSQKSKDYHGFKEEVFLYTFHDKQVHTYLKSLSIDCDKNDIVTTAQVSFRYDQRLMEYWIPGQTTFAIIGGSYDREILFVGRTSEINQRGDEIELVGQNIGWKFKMYMTTKFEEALANQPVKTVVKMIFRQLGLTKGKYHIDLSGIPDIDSYVLDEDGVITKGGEQVQNVPELTEVIKNLQSYDINKYIAKSSRTREVQEVADDYNKMKQKIDISYVTNNDKEHSVSYIRQNYGVKTSIKKTELAYEPILKRIQGSQDLKDYLIKGYSADSESTFEDVLHNIASAIDAHFFIVDTTVCFMSFNALIANSSMVQKAVTPTIDFWQLQDGSYDLNINQYGYYNTVIIHYKNGTLEKSYDDLVRVFGKISIEYKEPKLDYYGAQLKAQAYLSAHIRDFGMELKATMLHSGKYTVSNFVKLKNPLTMSEGLFYIYGTSIQWDASGQTLICDLDLRFGPENPDAPEVPETGLSYSGGGGGNSSNAIVNGNVSGNIKQAAQEMINGATDNDTKVLRIYNWVDTYVKYEFYYGQKYSSEEVLQKKRANCYDTAYLIYKLCSAVNIKCEVHSGNYHFLDSTYAHLWNMIYYKGKMTFADTGRESQNPIGEHGSGRYIISDSCVEKNY